MMQWQPLVISGWKARDLYRLNGLAVVEGGIDRAYVIRLDETNT